jgi:hypothetical protein
MLDVTMGSTFYLALYLFLWFCIFGFALFSITAIFSGIGNVIKRSIRQKNINNISVEDLINEREKDGKRNRNDTTPTA